MSRQFYELIPEEGKHLADSHNTEGAVRGVYLDDETNKPCGAGEFMRVNIDDEEDNDLVSEGLEEGALTYAAILAIGAGIGIAANKAYPYVKRWVTTTAGPGMKKFWRKVTRKELALEQTIECNGVEAAYILPTPEEFSRSIDLAVNEFRADMSSEEAQQHLLNIMCAAMYMASEIRQLSNAVLKDEDRLTWSVTLEKLTTQSVTDGINCILEREVLALDETQIKSLNEYFGGDIIVNGVFTPIEDRRIREALLVQQSNPKESLHGQAQQEVH